MLFVNNILVRIYSLSTVGSEITALFLLEFYRKASRLSQELATAKNLVRALAEGSEASILCQAMTLWIGYNQSCLFDVIIRYRIPMEE